MWKLTIEDDEQKQVHLQLAHAEYSVGRDEANTIRLTDRNVSRKHLVLRKSEKGWAVSDLQSYNGSYVNGERVAESHHVGHGDILQLGDYRLEFADETKTVAVPAATATPSLPPHHRPDRLVVVVGPQPGQEFFLDREHFTLGRSEEATVSVNHSSVSRIHAELFPIGNGRYEIIDKGSANGIRINGQEVRRGFIEAGDALELGDVRLRFVGAGKIFRAGFDRSQMLPAITGLDPSGRRPPPAQTANSSIMKMVAVGALLGILGVGATALYVTLKSPKKQPIPTPTSSASAEDTAGKALLEEATKLADKGDLEGAHLAIAKIDPQSPLLSGPEVSAIEGKWADALFAESETLTEEPEKQLEVLWRIATTPTVDNERRKKAAALAKAIDPDLPDPMQAKLGGAPAPALPPRPLPKPSASSTSKVGPGNTDRKALDDPKGRINELLSRLPTLSENELKLLIGLCMQENNAACRNRAAAQLGKLREQSKP